MGLFDPDPLDEPAMLEQLGAAPLTPEQLAALKAQIAQPLPPQSSQQLLDTLRNAPPEKPVMRAATMGERALTPGATLHAPGTGHPSPWAPPPGPTAMRAPTMREKVTDTLANVYEWAGQQPLGQMADLLGMSSFASNARQLRGDEPTPDLTIGIMPGGPGKPMLPSKARGPQIAQRIAELGEREGLEKVRLGDLMKYMLGWEGPAPKKVSVPQHSLMERAPVEMIGERLHVSNRVPTAVKSPIQPEGKALVTGLDEVLQSPELVQKFAANARLSPILTQQEAALSDRGVLDAMVNALQANNEFLLDKFSPYVPRSRKWYDGAHRISNELATEFGYHPNQTSGVIAVLSPQKDWHQNVEMAKRVIRNQRMFTDRDVPFSPEMADQYLRSQLETAEETIRTAQKKGLSNVVANQFRALVGQMSQKATRRMVGRPWSELSVNDRAIMMRAYDDLQHATLGKRFPTITPEGDILHPVTLTKEGKPTDMVWQSYKEIAKAISVLDDASPENISRSLGQAHKVRAFYNNINNPNYGRLLGERGSSTVDTHAVAAGHLQPMGTKSPEVEYAMGGASDALLGISGNNPLYQEAIARSGVGRGLLPREAQSPEWEALKGLFAPEKKRNKNFKEDIARLWREYNQGRLSREQVQDAIYNEAGGIPTPEWARPVASHK